MTEQNLELELKKARLKVVALLESNSNLQESNAEFRAEITLLADEVKALREYVANQEVQNAVVEEDTAAADPA